MKKPDVKIIDITNITSIKRNTSIYNVKLSLNIKGKVLSDFDINIDARSEEEAVEKAVEAIDRDLEFELEYVAKV